MSPVCQPGAPPAGRGPVGLRTLGDDRSCWQIKVGPPGGGGPNRDQGAQMKRAGADPEVRPGASWLSLASQCRVFAIG